MSSPASSFRLLMRALGFTPQAVGNQSTNWVVLFILMVDTDPKKRGEPKAVRVSVQSSSSVSEGAFLLLYAPMYQATDHVLDMEDGSKARSGTKPLDFQRVLTYLITSVVCNDINLQVTASYISFYFQLPILPSTLSSAMSQFTPSNSRMEIAPFVISTGLLCRTWDVISSRDEDEGIVSNKGEGLSWKVYKKPFSDFIIIAFEANTDSNLQEDLVLSSAIREMNFHHFDFLSTKRNPMFCVDRTAFSLLYKNHQRLDAWKKFEVNSSTPLIVTGHGLGGSVASLFTISLLESIRLGKNRPLCITFGSPLIGDKKLQQTLSYSPIWISCFLHVVSLKDPLPTLFITNPNPQANAYMPFGTFLLCSDENSTCFENPDTILELLKVLRSIHYQNQGFEFTHYGHLVEYLNHKAICKDLTSLVEDMPPLENSISLQFRALGLIPHMQQQNIDINTLVRRMENMERKFIFHKVLQFFPSKKPNVMKINMAKLEWYKKDCKNKNIGYYDSYKKMENTIDLDVVKLHKTLTNYWEKMVEEADNKPKKRGTAFRRSWLYAGTSYRRMVEPLAIADYYKGGGKDYVSNRSKHYVLLEEWFKNETTKAERSNIEAILKAENSYFWECVEKALLSRQQSMVVCDIEDNFDMLSDDEIEEAIPTMCPSFWSRVDGLLLSNKELNVDEEVLNGTMKDIKPCFEACVDGALLSRQGSVVVKDNEKNLNEFGAHVNKALLSRPESMVVRDRRRKINVEVILTTDSCFWAHVEEAILSCQELKVVEEKQDTLWKLVQFEDYVYRLLRNYELSPDIFLQRSSYMRWWNEYKAIKGTSYNSELAIFMNDPGKRARYTSGAYDFPYSLQSY
ncbi:hypothetical protein VNO77_35420 [Canavalia gladiata]|uniref:Senescence-associated carboxylesterase 101 n=1 Tax=Canavalia gladiata TaxID=3824 RepID=A0AAN9KEN2_CANGL